LNLSDLVVIFLLLQMGGLTLIYKH